MDFLIIVQFTTAWIARCMDVPNQVAILPQTPDHIAVHDLDMVNIKQ
jgi:hypothetical protein